eukprot:gene5461-11789_t
MDHHVAVIVAAPAASGVADRTLTLVTGDNGTAASLE